MNHLSSFARIQSTKRWAVRGILLLLLIVVAQVPVRAVPALLPDELLVVTDQVTTDARYLILWHQTSCKHRIRNWRPPRVPLMIASRQMIQE